MHSRFQHIYRYASTPLAPRPSSSLRLPCPAPSRLVPWHHVLVKSSGRPCSPVHHSAGSAANCRRVHGALAIAGIPAHALHLDRQQKTTVLRPQGAPEPRAHAPGQRSGHQDAGGACRGVHACAGAVRVRLDLRRGRRAPRALPLEHGPRLRLRLWQQPPHHLRECRVPLHHQALPGAPSDASCPLSPTVLQHTSGGAVKSCPSDCGHLKSCCCVALHPELQVCMCGCCSTRPGQPCWSDALPRPCARGTGPRKAVCRWGTPSSTRASCTT